MNCNFTWAVSAFVEGRRLQLKFGEVVFSDLEFTLDLADVSVREVLLLHDSGGLHLKHHVRV